MLTKLKMFKIFTVILAVVSVGLMVTGIPMLLTAGGWLFAASAVASIYLIYKDAKAKGKEALL